MIAGVFGLAGIITCLFLPDAVEKAQGWKVALLISVVLACFAVAIFGVAKQPAHMLGCDDYSIYASSC